MPLTEIFHFSSLGKERTYGEAARLEYLPDVDAIRAICKSICQVGKRDSDEYHVLFLSALEEWRLP